MTATRAQLVTETEDQSTGALAIALQELHRTGKLSGAERLVRNVIVATLYDRHPEVAAAYDGWIDSDSDEDVETTVINAAPSQGDSK